MKLIELLDILWKNINFQRRKQLVKLTLLMFIVSIFEVVGLGAVLPFLAVMMNPEKIYTKYFESQLYHVVSIPNESTFTLLIVAIFLFLIVFSSAIRVGLLWYTTRISFLIGADLSLDVFRKALVQPYKYHISNNSGELISTISIKVNAVIYGVILPILIMLSSLLTLILIVSFLIILEPVISLVTFLFLAAFYYYLAKATRKTLLHIKKWSKIVFLKHTRFDKKKLKV